MRLSMKQRIGLLATTLLVWTAAASGQTLPEWLQSMSSGGDQSNSAPAASRESNVPQSSEPQSANQVIAVPAGVGPVIEQYDVQPRYETVDERNAQQTADAPPDVVAPERSASMDQLYGVQPSDVLQISVWHEPELGREVAVSPDGRINYPLIGSLLVEGKSVDAIGKEIEAGLTAKFMKQAAVTVTIKEVLGNRIFVLGQVNRPGAFPFTKSLDVMQALSLAGGAAKFASLDDIRILRRVGGVPKAFAFDYSQVLKGRKLEQNIVLESGDVIMVP
jgi:polysaccharide export outer membrane protein